MKKFLLSLVIDMAVDYVIAVLRELAKRSSTKIDDDIVDEIQSNKEEIVVLIKEKL